MLSRKTEVKHKTIPVDRGDDSYVEIDQSSFNIISPKARIKPETMI